MALSFMDSLKAAQAESEAAAAVSAIPAVADNASVMTLDYGIAADESGMIAAYSGDDGNWTQDTKYPYFPIYSDENVSSINEKKEIILDPKQFNITQEENSQYIPFEMPRRYDNYDLTDAVISIHYTTSDGYHGHSKPINVSYNDDKIRFAWLVDSGATHVSGKLKFEIQAIGTTVGTDSDGKEITLAYVWKSKYLDGLNVIESICDGREIVLDEHSWVQELISSVAEKMAEEIGYVQVGEQVTQAKTAASEAMTYAVNASTSAANALASADEAKAAAIKAVADASAAGRDAANAVLGSYATDTDIETAVSDLRDEVADNYYTKTNADASVDSQITSALADYVAKDDLDNYYTIEEIEAVLSEDYYTQEEIDLAIENVEVDLTGYATEDYVDKAIADADLENYYTKEETYSQAEIDDKLKNVSLDGYATTTYVDNKVAPLSSSITTNAGAISSLGSTVAVLQETINNINASNTMYYRATYGNIESEDGSTRENIFTLWETEDDPDDENANMSVVSQFQIVGGGGGASSGSQLKIGYITTSPIVVTPKDSVVIKYNFSGVDSSDDIITEGVATWKVDGRVVATNTAIAGENSFDITEYIAIGTQKVNLSIVDDSGGFASKNWSVQKINVRLDSPFNDQIAYPIGTVPFDYTPNGAVEKVIHFILDGTEIGTITTSASGIPTSYDIPIQNHGSHLFEAYMTATINGNDIESNRIVKDIICYDDTSDVPIISCAQQEFTALQYDSTNIVYTVYDPLTETPVVTLAVDGKNVSTLTLDSSTQTWQYKSSDVGEHILTITCGNTVKTIKANIEKLDIEVTPETGGLVFDFNPVGKSNGDADRLWSDGDIAMTVSDNFDWVNGGYQIDEKGNQYFCIKAGTSAEINYKLFEDDAKRNGKEFKLIFKTTNVQNAGATFLSCADGSDNARIGVEMNVHEAYVHASAGSLYLPYSEEDVIEFEFNINENSQSKIPMVMGYEDGVATRPMIYSDSHNFTQTNPQYITIGSEYCDVFVYRFKVYSKSLTDKGILNNFIADALTADEMIARYTRNQIYDENQQLTPAILAEKCPHLRIIMIDAPHFTNNKSNKVANTTVQCIYKNGHPDLDNWTAYNCQHSGQGTTSNEYGAAGRNLDLIMNDSGIDGVEPYIKLANSGTEVSKVSLTRDSVEVDYFNIKVNIASSENANNALLAKRYNAYNPYIRSAKLNDSKVKDTMEFVNCVVFIRENNPDVSTHREFDDCEWHFYAIGNIGDSKKTDKTRLNDPNDPLECIVEIMDNTFPNSTFPTGDYDSEGRNVYPIDKSKWVAGNEAYDALYADLFDETSADKKANGLADTYGWRYSYNKKDSSVTSACIDKWREFYTFVVTSSDDEFKANLKNYFVVESALYYYLFTTRYTMIDNRAKNSFWHYAKCDDGVYRWDLCFNYDNDTSLGINNSGELTMTYGYEDIDYKTKGDASTGWAYNAATSTFFCRIRDLFVDELRDMFVRCEDDHAWDATGLINQFDEWQSQFPEELWRLDIERKYLRTYREGSPRFLTTMMNGRKKYQRRQFERNQEKYMASKFFGNVAVSDQIMFRCNTPTDRNLVVKPDYTLHLTPYSDMYLSVLFGATDRKQIRAEAGKQYDITCPFTTMDDTAVLVYCASLIQSMGDVSACYIHDNDFSKATKLKELIIGNDTEGYQNSFLTNLTLGNNTLLEKLDIQNTPNLNQALNLSGCNNLKELYAYGSGLTGVTFADGGMIETAELPAINSITMRNLMYLDDFDISSYNNLTTLTIENCDTIDVRELFENATNINRVRITGVNWSFEDTSLLNKIYGMAGIDKSGYNVPQSVLAGDVYVATIKSKEIDLYKTAWPDLNLTYNPEQVIKQYTVTFQNYDGTMLDEQLIDEGEDAVDPTKRYENRIEIPIRPSSESYDYTFSNWDSSLENIFSDRIITAVYSESLREYTIEYVVNGKVEQTSTGKYGDYILYTKETPTYTGGERAFNYQLFKDWDKSGYVDGDKRINAVFDTCKYETGYFSGKNLSELRPVEIYALTKVPSQISTPDSIVTIQDLMDIEVGNDYSITFGYDIDYEDIPSQLIIDDKVCVMEGDNYGKSAVFTGSNYINTKIKPFDEDRDFVLAIDYSMPSTNPQNGVLAQCYDSSNKIGFKLRNNSGVKLSFGASSEMTPSNANEREMLVIRHEKGSKDIHIYSSNLSSMSAASSTLSDVRVPVISGAVSGELVFGASRMSDGAYETYGIGDVYWCKIWYKDLGDDVCMKLAGWTHEKIDFDVCGFKRFYLSDGSGQRCNFSLLAQNLLERTRTYNGTTSSSVNTGGWASSYINSYLNRRLYENTPIQIKQLLKQVVVWSTIGDISTELSSSDCYFTIPALVEVSASYNSTSAYSNEMAVDEGKTIPFMSTNSDRRRAVKGKDYSYYWLRSPSLSYTYYTHAISSDGYVSSTRPYNKYGILLEISF